MPTTDRSYRQILQAQHFANRLYKDVPRYCLTWKHRHPLLVKEVLFWQPDVVCMQEVEYFKDMEEALAKSGWVCMEWLHGHVMAAWSGCMGMERVHVQLCMVWVHSVLHAMVTCHAHHGDFMLLSCCSTELAL